MTILKENDGRHENKSHQQPLKQQKDPSRRRTPSDTCSPPVRKQTTTFPQFIRITPYVA